MTPIAQHHALNRARRFARRALIIARPARVRIRARKPWVRLRFNVLGWKVRFIAASPKLESANHNRRGFSRQAKKTPNLYNCAMSAMSPAMSSAMSPAMPSIDLAAAIGARLRELDCTVSCVESCTAGGVAHAITAIAGASAWFRCGYVVYDNAAKVEMVGVAAELIDAHGAVSEQVAASMAENGLRAGNADFCVAITGVAGPGGGSAEKPVGTVYFSWAGKNRPTRTKRQHFEGGREAVRAQSISFALRGLLDMIAA